MNGALTLAGGSGEELLVVRQCVDLVSAWRNVFRGIAHGFRDDGIAFLGISPAVFGRLGPGCQKGVNISRPIFGHGAAKDDHIREYLGNLRILTVAIQDVIAFLNSLGRIWFPDIAGFNLLPEFVRHGFRANVDQCDVADGQAAAFQHFAHKELGISSDIHTDALAPQILNRLNLRYSGNRGCPAGIIDHYRFDAVIAGDGQRIADGKQPPVDLGRRQIGQRLGEYVVPHRLDFDAVLFEEPFFLSDDHGVIAIPICPFHFQRWMLGFTGASASRQHDYRQNGNCLL